MSQPTDSDNYFACLNAINVNERVEKKGGFSYLSWPYAVAQLRLADPTATWEVRRFDGLPYLATEAGVFVEVAVTVKGVTLSQIHPVLDGRNRPLLAPSAFDINTSLQRCLVKAIALHGLGLYIYAGEDLPQPVGTEAANDPVHPPPQTERPSLASNRPPVRRDDDRERITKSQQAQIHKLAIEVGVSLDRSGTGVFWGGRARRHRRQRLPSRHPQPGEAQTSGLNALRYSLRWQHAGTNHPPNALSESPPGLFYFTQWRFS